MYECLHFKMKSLTCMGVLHCIVKSYSCIKFPDVHVTSSLECNRENGGKLSQLSTNNSTPLFTLVTYQPLNIDTVVKPYPVALYLFLYSDFNNSSPILVCCINPCLSLFVLCFRLFI